MYQPTSVRRIECGKIFIMPNDIFALMCKFCDEDFFNLDEFRDHLTEHFSEERIIIKEEDSVSYGGSESDELTLTEIHDEMNQNIPNQFYLDDFLHQEDAVPVPDSHVAFGADEDCKPSVSRSFFNDKEPIVRKQSARSQRRHQPKRQCKLYQSIDENETGQENSHYMFRKRLQKSAPLAVNVAAENKTSSDSRRHCRFCPKTFRDEKYRSYHENTHTGNRPYKCTVCSKAYAGALSLSTVGKCRSGPCAKRAKTSASSGLPLQGNRVHTDEQRDTKLTFEIQNCQDLQADTDSPRYKCQYCHRTFTLRGNRARHELMCCENTSI